MADGGQAIDQAQVIELAARRLARALGTGQAWYAEVQVAADLLAEDELPQSERLSVARRGRVVEKAARSVAGSRHVRRELEWRHSPGVSAVARCRPDLDALAALSFAKLDGPLEAMLLLYATGDVPRYWPTVKRYGLAYRSERYAEQAITDAAKRLLCGCADLAQDERAKALKIRASTYRHITRDFERVLRHWLGVASHRFLLALNW